MNKYKTKRKITSVSFIFLLITYGFIGFFLIEIVIDNNSVEAVTIIVDCNGTGDYLKIQDAIDFVNPGDIIYVWSGVYSENLIIDKSVKLVGNGSANSFINGTKANEMINIIEDRVEISGLSIKGSYDYDTAIVNTGIKLNSVKNCKITHNNISDVNNGIELLSSTNIEISNNTCFEGNYGIRIQNSNNNIIENNNCSYFGEIGILIKNSFNIELINNTCYHLHNSISLFNSFNIKLRDNTCHKFGHGIYLFSSMNNTLVNNICSKNWDLVNDGKGILLQDSSNNKLINNLCFKNQHGIYMINSSNNLIINNNCSNNKDNYVNKEDSGIYLLYSSNNTIENNTCLNNKNCGIDQRFSNDNIINDNILNSNGCCGISLSDSWSNKLSNNQVNFSDLGIFIKKSNNNQLEKNNCFDNYIGVSVYQSSNNTLENNTSMYNFNGFNIKYSIDIKVINNKCLNNSNDGMYLFSLSKSLIINNKCLNNQENGILAGSSLNNIFGSNKFEKNNKNGIYFYSKSSLNEFENNTCNFNNEHGIMFTDTNLNTINKNNISYNKKKGIFFFGDSDNNSIFENLILENKINGIEIASKAKNNHIFHNIISFNTNQAIDNGSNYWNNSNQEGNYWSDYSGKDNGSNGRIAGDGIGDTKIPHQKLDNYPFVKSFGWLYPGTPILIVSKNISRDGNYVLSWNQTRNTKMYILEESNSKTFESFIEIYSGEKISFEVNNKPEGSYFYRVKASNENYKSDCSKIVNITVDYQFNLPPVINYSIESLEILEDMVVTCLINLNDWFYDPNGDILTFSVKGSNNISIKIFNNGTVMLLPKIDWNGNETLIFIANDTLCEINVTVVITVLGINDPPKRPLILQPIDNEYFEIFSNISFYGSCDDVDIIYGDKLNYTWFSNISGILGFSAQLSNITFQLGVHKITLLVSDLENASNSTNITIIVHLIDSDNDGYNDTLERFLGTNPYNNTSYPPDYDHDLIPDDLDLNDDNDGFSDKEEWLNGTDPYDEDDYPNKEDNSKESQGRDYTIFVILCLLITIILIILAVLINSRMKKNNIIFEPCRGLRKGERFRHRRQPRGRNQ